MLVVQIPYQIYDLQISSQLIACVFNVSTVCIRCPKFLSFMRSSLSFLKNFNTSWVCCYTCKVIYNPNATDFLLYFLSYTFQFYTSVCVYFWATFSSRFELGIAIYLFLHTHTYILTYIHTNICWQSWHRHKTSSGPSIFFFWSILRVGKLLLMGPIQSNNCFINKVLLECSHTIWEVVAET
jgi:hypothetical protein